MDNNKTAHNYQIDVLKLFFCFMVFLSHTTVFVNENTQTFFIPPGCGWLPVHFFFTVSGYLMVNSYFKRHDQYSGSGREAWLFVKHKLSGIIWQYWAALLISAVISAVCWNIRGISTTGIFNGVVRCIPEMLMTTQGITATSMLNTPAWYIIAMLICMLPLSYILIRNSDFYLYVFAPTAAVLLTVYMYRCPEQYLDPDGLLAASSFTGIVTGGIIRACCGICWGAVCKMADDRLKNTICTKKRRLMLTFFEFLLYAVFFFAWFNGKSDKNTVFANMFILALLISIIFSGRSYVSLLFGSKLLKYAGSLSLAFFLNHYSAVKLVSVLFPERSYRFSVLLSLAFTAVNMVIYFILLRFIRLFSDKNFKTNERNDIKCHRQ